MPAARGAKGLAGSPRSPPRGAAHGEDTARASAAALLGAMRCALRPGYAVLSGATGAAGPTAEEAGFLAGLRDAGPAQGRAAHRRKLHRPCASRPPSRPTRARPRWRWAPSEAPPPQALVTGFGAWRGEALALLDPIEEGGAHDDADARPPRPAARRGHRHRPRHAAWLRRGGELGRAARRAVRHHAASRASRSTTCKTTIAGTWTCRRTPAASPCTPRSGSSAMRRSRPRRRWPCRARRGWHFPGPLFLGMPPVEMEWPLRFDLARRQPRRRARSATRR